jgi:hypothetical protein
MNSSLATADRTTHLKIVVVALVAGLVFMAVAISAHASTFRFVAAIANEDRVSAQAGKAEILANGGHVLVRRE